MNLPDLEVLHLGQFKTQNFARILSVARGSKALERPSVRESQRTERA